MDIIPEFFKVYTRAARQTRGSCNKRPGLGWAFFDKIYCISLDTRDDRRQRVKKEFARVGVLELVEFVIVSKNTRDPEKGIFDSHLHCLKRGLAAGGQHILVFEDDVFFEHFNPAQLDKACTFLENGQNRWDGFFLGCLTTGSRQIRPHPVAKINYRCLAHAYALNRPFAQALTRRSWTGIPFDELLRQNQGDFVALYPMCAFQGRSGTDNKTAMLAFLRSLFGGLAFIQKANQFYQHHKLLLAGVHLVVFLLLLVLGSRLLVL